MTQRLVGLLITSLAVIVLLGSLVVGLRGPRTVDGWEPVPISTLREGADRIRVEVLNGAGVEGLARETTERLRASGFDVVYYGNAGALARDSTVVLDRGSDPAAVARVAQELGIERVEIATDTTLYLEATVILAPDWGGITPPEQ
jgi:hypothetical protein